MLKKILYGASIHPGNGMYVVMLLMGVMAGLLNENTPWWFGFVILVVLVPLYMWTSYEVGKANWPPETRSPKE